MIDGKLLEELSAAKLERDEADRQAQAARGAAEKANARSKAAWDRYQRARLAVEEAA